MTVENLINIIPPDLETHLRKFYETQIEKEASLKSDLKDAIKQGDLSENATFDNVKAELEVLGLSMSINRGYLNSVEVKPYSEIYKICPNYHSKLHIKIKDISTQVETFLDVIITPPIDLDIPNAIFITSDLGRVLLNTEVGKYSKLVSGSKKMFITLVSRELIEDDSTYGIFSA